MGCDNDFIRILIIYLILRYPLLASNVRKIVEVSKDSVHSPKRGMLYQSLWANALSHLLSTQIHMVPVVFLANTIDVPHSVVACSPVFCLNILAISIRWNWHTRLARYVAVCSGECSGKTPIRCFVTFMLLMWPSHLFQIRSNILMSSRQYWE